MQPLDTHTACALAVICLLALVLILWANGGDGPDDPNDGWR